MIKMIGQGNYKHNQRIFLKTLLPYQILNLLNKKMTGEKIGRLFNSLSWFFPFFKTVSPVIHFNKNYGEK